MAHRKQLSYVEGHANDDDEGEREATEADLDIYPSSDLPDVARWIRIRKMDQDFVHRVPVLPGQVADLVLVILENSWMIRVLAMISMTSCLISSSAPSLSSSLTSMTVIDQITI